MKRGPEQILIALDELANAFMFGDGRHTISARAGYALHRGKRWARVLVPVIDRFFGKGHCVAQAIAEGLIHAS
jgi:hypothetical protein